MFKKRLLFIILLLKVILSFQLNSKYLGCFDDGLDGVRDLDGFYFDNLSSMKIELCFSECFNRGFKYFGLQYRFVVYIIIRLWINNIISFHFIISVQCFCGNSYGRYKKNDDSVCNMACKGDPTQKCGQSYKSSVYEIIDCKLLNSWIISNMKIYF